MMKKNHQEAQKLIDQLAQAAVGGIRFSAGEPFLYFNEIAALVNLFYASNMEGILSITK
jgi:hypothetical protein